MRCMKGWGLVLLVFSTPVASGQGYSPIQAKNVDPRVKRLARERAVAYVGAIGRPLVEIYGEDAVAAIFACSKATGRKLAEFHVTGRLDKVPNPVRLLNAIATHSDPVATFAIGHCQELADEWRFEAFIADPMTYAMALKNLDAGVAENRQELENTERQQKVMLGVGGGLMLLVALLVLRFRQRRFQ
jgi:hypothetical protein